MSRNADRGAVPHLADVTSREGRVSRNVPGSEVFVEARGHVPRGACE